MPSRGHPGPPREQRLAEDNRATGERGRGGRDPPRYDSSASRRAGSPSSLKFYVTVHPLVAGLPTRPERPAERCVVASFFCHSWTNWRGSRGHVSFHATGTVSRFRSVSEIFGLCSRCRFIFSFHFTRKRSLASVTPCGPPASSPGSRARSPGHAGAAPSVIHPGLVPSAWTPRR